MDEGAVAAKVQIPAVGRRIEPLFLDAHKQPIVVVLALRPPDDLAVPLRRETIAVEHGARVVGILLHVEGLDAPWIVEDEQGTVIFRREKCLVIAPDIASTYD